MTELPDHLKAPILDLAAAKKWIEDLHVADMLFHFEDSAPTIGNMVNGEWVRLFSDEDAKIVDAQVEAIYGFDFGEYECPIGYALSLSDRPRERGRAMSEILFKEDMEPAAAIKKLRALRNVNFTLYSDYSMPTTEGRHFVIGETLSVSFSQVENLLKKLQRFRELKLEKHPETPEADLPKVSVSIHSLGSGRLYAHVG